MLFLIESLEFVRGMLRHQTLFKIQQESELNFIQWCHISIFVSLTFSNNCQQEMSCNSDLLALGKSYPSCRDKLAWYRKAYSVLSLALVLQLPFCIVLICLIYGIVYLDFRILGVLLMISLLQYKVKRNEQFVRFINSLVKPLLYMKKYHKIYEEEIDPDQKALFGIHPHSVFAYGCLSNMNIEGDVMYNMVCLGSKFILNIPFTGLLLRLWGVQAVDSKNLAALMKQGKQIGLLPGGFQEATITTPKEMRFFIKERKGFVKFAIRNGYTLYPVIVMNEHKAYWTFDYLLKMRLLLNRIKFPGVFFLGPFGVVLRPDIEFVTVVGKAIRGKGDSQQEIDRCHEEYVEELKRLYTKYKSLNGDVPLAIY